MKAVALGGGHGASRSLRALSTLTGDVTAIVTVADNGGSSGRLRRDLDVIPPGDLRMALSALAPDGPLVDLIAHRFDQGALAGHSLGNLVLLALMEQHDHDVVRALAAAGALMGLSGRVLPCTCVPVELHARTDAGTLHGQVAVATTPGIQRVWLEPADPPATPEAVEAILEADVVVLGPGSLVTSLLPNLLVPGIAQALSSSQARVVLIGNLHEQHGETQGLDLADHIAFLEAHVSGLRLDTIIVNRNADDVVGVRPLRISEDRLGPHATKLVHARVAGSDSAHDPARLAHALAGVIAC